MTAHTDLPLMIEAPKRRWLIDPVRGLSLGTPAQLMGIVNVTPDSFSDGGAHQSVEQAVVRAQAMQAAGAAWLDVGGESTRPGAAVVGARDECARVLPVITALTAVHLPISIDTSKAEVAEVALAAGAVMVNDVTAGADPGMFAVVAGARCPMVLMHMQGTPLTMQQAPTYADVVDEVLAFLVARLAAAVRAGIAEQAVVLDPGIGFGKRPEHNLSLLRALPRLVAETGRPLLLGVSRKAIIASAAGVDLPPGQRDALSHVVHAICAPWCALLRVHDVPGAAAAIRLSASLREGGH